MDTSAHSVPSGSHGLPQEISKIPLNGYFKAAPKDGKGPEEILHISTPEGIQVLNVLRQEGIVGPNDYPSFIDPDEAIVELIKRKEFTEVTRWCGIKVRQYCNLVTSELAHRAETEMVDALSNADETPSKKRKRKLDLSSKALSRFKTPDASEDEEPTSPIAGRGIPASASDSTPPPKRLKSTDAELDGDDDEQDGTQDTEASTPAEHGHLRPDFLKSTAEYNALSASEKAKYTRRMRAYTKEHKLPEFHPPGKEPRGYQDPFA